MTYWPISSPSVFAAAKHTRAESTRLSEDGLEPQSPREYGDQGDDGAGSSVAESDGQDGDDEAAGQRKPAVGETAEQKHASRQGHEQLVEDDVSGEIIGIKVTRSGHMFATITWSTLTIWQTKARFPRPSMAHWLRQLTPTSPQLF
jgi:hypothetical protein